MIRTALSRSPSASPKVPHGRISKPHKDDSSFLLKKPKSASWIEIEDDLAVLLHGHETSLQHFHRMFQQHSRVKLPSDVLLCLACLVTYDRGESTSKFYSFSLTRFASFLVDGKVGDEIKLACLRLVIAIRSSHDPTAAWQLRDSVIQENLRFILDLEESMYMKHHSEQVFLWELRAICQCQLNRKSSAPRFSKR